MIQCIQIYMCLGMDARYGMVLDRKSSGFTDPTDQLSPFLKALRTQIKLSICKYERALGKQSNVKIQRIKQQPKKKTLHQNWPRVARVGRERERESIQSNWSSFTRNGLPSMQHTAFHMSRAVRTITKTILLRMREPRLYCTIMEH